MTDVLDDSEENNFVFTTEHMCNNNIIKGIANNWVLLDNHSTGRKFNNKRLLIDIKKTKKWMKVKCNARMNKANIIGKIKGFPGDVWYHPNRVSTSYQRLK